MVLLEDRLPLFNEGDIDHENNLSVLITKHPEANREWLKGVYDGDWDQYVKGARISKYLNILYVRHIEEKYLKMYCTGQNAA